MEIDAIVGCAITVIALVGMAGLVWWSHKTIDWISRTGPRSARKILNDMRSDGSDQRD